MSVKRLLTPSELEDILSEITLISPSYCLNEIYQSQTNKLKKEIALQLSNQYIYPSMINALKKEIISNFRKSLVQAGESVGIVAAQSIGERQTQTTLSSFHLAGLSLTTLVTGVDRFSELLSATKKPKGRTALVRFSKDNDSIDKVRKSFGNKITNITIRGICSLKVIDKNNAGIPSFYKLFNILYNPDLSKYADKFVRITLKREKMYEYNISPEMIGRKIMSLYADLYCIWSPITCEEGSIVDVYIDVSEIDTEYTGVENSSDEESDYSDSDKDSVEKVSQQREAGITSYITGFIVPKLKNISISGVPGVNNIFFKNIRGTEWAIETEGSNLLKILMIDGVNIENTISNDMWEIYNLFGIEAVRQFLIEEFINVASSDGTFINDRHIKLLVDVMTFSGTINSISRYGMKKNQMGVLAKGSFETILDIFLKAGVYGDFDNTKGVSASILCGKVPKVGTGICEIKLDLSKFNVKK